MKTLDEKNQDGSLEEVGKRSGKCANKVKSGSIM